MPGERHYRHASLDTLPSNKPARRETLPISVGYLSLIWMLRHGVRATSAAHGVYMNLRPRRLQKKKQAPTRTHPLVSTENIPLEHCCIPPNSLAPACSRSCLCAQGRELGTGEELLFGGVAAAEKEGVRQPAQRKYSIPDKFDSRPRSTIAPHFLAAVEETPCCCCLS